MYEVDGLDVVVALGDLPPSSAGAPLPTVVASEHRVVIAYHAAHPDPDWDGTYVRLLDQDSDEPVIILAFEGPTAHMFGPPNDETLHGHPLWDRGLSHYGMFRVEQSSWIRALQRINSVHSEHSPRVFASQTHFVLAFHDSTFECIARSVRATTGGTTLRDSLTEMCQRLYE